MITKKIREAACKETEMQLTPMIDVTFLLLIFFMCSIKFKLLDGKLGAYLPKDSGVNAGEAEEVLEDIEIRLARVNHTPLGFEIFVNGRHLPGLKALFQRVKYLHDHDSTLRAILYPGKGIQHGQVVTVLDECLKAGLTRISFGAIRPDD